MKLSSPSTLKFPLASINCVTQQSSTTTSSILLSTQNKNKNPHQKLSLISLFFFFLILFFTKQKLKKKYLGFKKLTWDMGFGFLCLHSSRAFSFYGCSLFIVWFYSKVNEYMRVCLCRVWFLFSGQCNWTRWIRNTCRVSNAFSGHWTEAESVYIYNFLCMTLQQVETIRCSRWLIHLFF